MPIVPETVLSHWSKLVEGFKTSSLDFYAQVEQAFRVREIPDIEVSRIEWAESGVLSARRQYLRVKRGNHAFDICAAPFGSGYFFSWWLAAVRPPGVLLYFIGLFVAVLILVAICFSFGFFKGLLFSFFGVPALLAALGWGVRERILGSEEVVLAMPGIGWLYERFFAPPTYYRLDAAIMFRESVSSAVNEVLGALLKEQGLRALTTDDLRPSIRDLAGS